MNLLWIAVVGIVASSMPQQKPGGAPSFEIKGAPVAIEPYVEVDGAKTPELLPEHAVWRSGFDTLRRAAESNAKPILLNFTVQGPDRSAVFDEAVRQGRLNDDCYARQEESKASMLPQGVPFEKIPMQTLRKASEANRAIILECRQRVLDGSDLLLRKISPENAAILTQWMNDRRGGIKLMVPKSDLNSGWYRLPR